MGKKSLALGMIVPLAAAGAVATAPSASAAPTVRFNSVRCDLDAHRIGGIRDGRILVVFRVNDRNRFGDRDRNLRNSAWTVRITQDNRVILRDVVRSRDGSFTVRDVARNTRGSDVFRATAVNNRTRQSCASRVFLR